MAPRAWSWWSEHKLDILSDYLSAFTRACKKSSKTVYLDLFAGSPANISREHGHNIDGSPHRALRTDPPFTTLRFFELPGKAEELERRLRAEYPGRDIRVYPGDCNETIGGALRELHASDAGWAPTFAFVDQQSTQIRWDTLRMLAQHRSGRKKGMTKVELWILCASGMIPRAISLNAEFMNARFAEQVDEMFGTTLWRDALKARKADLLTGEGFREELRNLMRWRLEHDLGYHSTQVFKVVNTSGHEIYDMVFATDHDAGQTIMRKLYGNAARQQEAMRRQALQHRRDRRDEEKGLQHLFGAAEMSFSTEKLHPSKLYVYEPPHEPYRMRPHPGHAETN